MTFKSFGPGSPTGAEGDSTSGPGNTSYYPNRESEGESVGGEDLAPGGPASSVPSRPNPQSGDIGGVTGAMNSALQESASYGGHGVSQGGVNPTGSNINSPAGDRTSQDAGAYGVRQTP